MNDAERILIDVIALDENWIKIDFKFDLTFDFEIDHKIELMTENSALRNLTVRKRIRGNFGLTCFDEYALSCSQIAAWIRTSV